jgi:glycosyltransferase involved in cell wall biosynthesis
MRILHVVGGMNRGGIETWLMHVLRNIDRDQFQMDFLVHSQQPCPYDDELLELGSKILYCPYHSKPWLYGPAFRRLMREHGPYDIVHSHVHDYSGFVLRLAHRSHIKGRIAHSHNDTIHFDNQSNLVRRKYLDLMRYWIKRYASVGLACSQEAAKALYGVAWNNDSRWHVLHCGLDFSPFYRDVDSTLIRAELGIPKDAWVIGHVGRFVKQKNHAFLVAIAREIIQHVPNAHFLLVGEGTLRQEIESKVMHAGLRDAFTFAGSRPDVPQIMHGAMDAFLLPSLFEGLGLVLVEAQAAGLPCIFSDVVPPEADIVQPLITRVSLSQSAEVWAKQVFSTYSKPPDIPRSEALDAVATGSFSIQNSIAHLSSIYHDALN